VITSDGAYRNAQIVPFKEEYTDKALDNYIPLEMALELVTKKLQALKVPVTVTEQILSRIQTDLGEEITVERSDVMRSVGLALAKVGKGEAFADQNQRVSSNPRAKALPLPIQQKSRIRTEIAKCLVDSPPRVQAVIVVRHTGQEINWRPERDKWSHELLAQAEKELFARVKQASISVSNETELMQFGPQEFIRAICASTPCEPVDAEFPLFFIYTSGSTGKPKGVVHVHGGYTAGIAHTMRIAFDARSGEDTIYVIADPGWITGQSYLISGVLLLRLTGIICEGSPLFPSPGRFASIIERYRVNIFKAGVTFLKSVMTNPQNVEEVQQYSMKSLRVATFCAEPCSPAVQEFGMKIMTPQYINSYWATEHGGIVWTHFFGNPDFPLRADAHTYPLPWVFGDVWVSVDEDQESMGVWEYGSMGEQVPPATPTHPHAHTPI
ncbi:MAG: AMP-binding protein, partial [Nitrospira sp.]|nr:AMP-binding protein [Nitrospira sp.]